MFGNGVSESIGSFSQQKETQMATRGVTIAIDGGGFAQFKFLSGSLTGFSFGVGANVPITIEEAQPNSLKAGKCSQDWFRATVEEATSDTFISVEVITDNNASCNFLPDGLAGYHIDAGKDKVLNYSRTKEGNLHFKVDAKK
jgi:hypothetical protein